MKKANFCYAVLTASAVLTLGTGFSASAAQWQALGDEWVYVQNDGEYFKDGWKQDGNLYYYLGSDGIMLRRTLIEDDDNYYYLGSSGAMANPVPEIMPDVAKAAGARIVGTGRSDFPNQVNNVVAFPGIFKGALEGRATQITEEMKLAAAEAIAGLVSDEELNDEFIMPEAFDPRVAQVVSEAVRSHIVR